MLVIDFGTSLLASDYELIHESLVGSPSYINSEVLLNKEEGILIVGNENEHNRTINIEVASFQNKM